MLGNTYNTRPILVLPNIETQGQFEIPYLYNSGHASCRHVHCPVIIPCNVVEGQYRPWLIHAVVVLVADLERRYDRIEYIVTRLDHLVRSLWV